MNSKLLGVCFGLLLGLGAWPVMAQDSPAVDAAEPPVGETATSGPTESKPGGEVFKMSVDVGGASAEGDAEVRKHGISITVDTDDDERSKRVRLAGAVVDEVVGELERALEGLPEDIRGELDEEEMEELRDAIRDIENLKETRHVVHERDSDTISEVLPAVVAIVLLFGGPVLIVAIVSTNNRRKRQLVHQTIDKIIEQGRDVPVELLDALDKGKNGKSPLAKGMVNIAIGVGICAWLYSLSGADVATLGLIPLFIGIAQIVIWKLETPELRSPGA